MTESEGEAAWQAEANRVMGLSSEEKKKYVTGVLGYSIEASKDAFARILEVSQEMKSYIIKGQSASPDQLKKWFGRLLADLPVKPDLP